jgi:hypothetical protein
MSDGRLSIQKSGFFHCGGDVLTAFFPERSGNAPVVLSLCERQTVFKFNDPRDFLTPGVVVG